MTFNDDARLDSSQVADRRGWKKVAFGGGIIGVIATMIYSAFLAWGGNDADKPPSEQDITAAQSLAQQCQTGRDANARTDCRMIGYANSIQAFWAATLPAAGTAYAPATTVIFSGNTPTGCGLGTSDIGPFYCSRDKHIYLDLDFFEALKTKIGARGGPFAQAYIVAHEFGHHVQNLNGTWAKKETGSQQGADSTSVRLELQADCLAGVWAHHAATTKDSQGHSLFTGITQADIEEGLNAASVIGDDRLQSKFNDGKIDKDTWTHGSSEQRVRWFTAGYRGGTLSSCDTFAGSV